MTIANPPYEKNVKLGIIQCSEELKRYAEKITEEIPGLIDINFDHNNVLFHYNNNGMSIDILAEFLQKMDIEIEDSIMNKIKLCYHSFIDANARANATSKPVVNDSIEPFFKHKNNRHH